MRASELYALSQSSRCEGKEACHWCLGPCTQLWRHDDVTHTPFSKSPQMPRNPAGHYVCSGCWHWRRKRLTVDFLSGGYKDRQEPKDWSWLLTKDKAWGVRVSENEFGDGRKDGQQLFNILLKPPAKFCLSLITTKVPNLIHLMAVNETGDVKADTTFKFTLDHALYEYTVYELEEALTGREDDSQGKSPGVRALVRLFGSRRETGKPLAVADAPVRARADSDKAKNHQIQKMKRFLR